MKLNSGIYKIENILNKKVYVGSTANFKRRALCHSSDLKFDRRKNPYLQNSYNKHGKENFVFEIIEYVERDKKILLEREDYWINFLKANDRRYGYNIRKVAESNLGIKQSLETRLKKSKALCGEKHPNFGKHHSLETIQKMSKTNMGHKVSEITRQKQSSAIKGEKHPNFGKHLSSEIRQKQSNAKMGKKLSEEHKQKISEGNMGHKVSEKTREKQSKSMSGKYNGEKHPNFGKHHSIETIQKMRENHVGMIGKHHSIETIQKISGINNNRIIKKEIILQIRNMLDNKMFMIDIAKFLNINRETVSKVKRGWYKDIYGI